ncbi:unnamed protein product [Sphenostylis stenocarpa]|uniref:Uncharacterized protein n=1 Tax=Sphenostylis stenocarpa TaxID=92480 RepID=A0AA86SKF6_9FABA|nr:unnamed protein product [Sphenostylis stenocarpa]
MEGQNSYLMRLNCGGPPLQVYDFKTPKYLDREEPGVFCVRRCIKFSVGKRVCAFNITEKSKEDRVYSVNIDVTEQSGKGSYAKTSMWFGMNNRYDILCSVRSMLSGSYELFRQNYSVPTLPDIESTGFFCSMSGYGSYFTLEKKKLEKSEVVERVKSTHDFLVGGDETVNVKVKITNDKKVGLRVEVERPVKLTLDYSCRVFEKMEEKMEDEIQKNMLSFLRNATAELPPDESPTDPFSLYYSQSGRVRHKESLFHGHERNNQF